MRPGWGRSSADIAAIPTGNHLFDAPNGFSGPIPDASADEPLQMNFTICHYPDPGMRLMTC